MGTGLTEEQRLDKLIAGRSDSQSLRIIGIYFGDKGLSKFLFWRDRTQGVYIDGFLDETTIDSPVLIRMTELFAAACRDMYDANSESAFNDAFNNFYNMPRNIPDEIFDAYWQHFETVWDDHKGWLNSLLLEHKDNLIKNGPPWEYDEEGFNKFGYDEYGYDKNHLNKLGLDMEGYDKDGYTESGWDRNGYDKEGYNRYGFNQEGYDEYGYDKNGLNKKGLDREGYDKDGYTVTGWDRNGYDRLGLDKDGYTGSGYDINGYDKNGYDRFGYNQEGYNQAGFNREGFNSDGYNRAGYNSNGYDCDGYDRHGFDINGNARNNDNFNNSTSFWDLFGPSEAHAMTLEEYSKFMNGKGATLPCDPLVLDLDDDGFETVSENTGITFDHDGDGLKAGTGWVNSDDGFLVYDRNFDGVINNGGELFGEHTELYDGSGFAKSAFEALAQEDTNGDGIVNAEDDNWNSLKVWRDLNQDGVSQSNELFTLEELGIAGINVGSTSKVKSVTGGWQTATGTYIKDDGTTGNMGQFDFSNNTFYREFQDKIEVPEDIQALPNMQGSGLVRDLQEAATLSPELKNLLEAFTAAETRDAQLGMLEELLYSWVQTAGFQTFEERFGDTYNIVHNNVPDGDVATWQRMVSILEAFNGQYFFDSETHWTISIKQSQNGETKPTLTINWNIRQITPLQGLSQISCFCVKASVI